MRFIFNFFFFGILFYLIWMFFPDAFMTLVNWANHVVTFFKELFINLSDKFQQHAPAEPSHAPAPAAFMLMSFLSLR